MAWRFRTSFKIIPGLKLNLSKSGLSASIGGAPFSLNLGPRGVYGTTSLPGTGVSFRHRLTGASGTPQPPDSSLPIDWRPADPATSVDPTAPAPLTPPPEPSLAPITSPVQEVRSASTELLTSQTLQDLKRLIQTAYEEREEITRELAASRAEGQLASAKYLSWQNGFLMKRLFKRSFAERLADAETASAKTSQLEEQLRLTTVATQVDISKEQAEPYFRMRDEFAALAECTAIWDKKSRQSTDKVRERTTADERVVRERVTFSLKSSDLIQWEERVPHLQNANGGDMFCTLDSFCIERRNRRSP